MNNALESTLLKMGVNEYINNLPLKVVFSKDELKAKFLYTYAVPAKLSDMCENLQLDISSISFWAYKNLYKNYEILPNFCISCKGRVKSVKLLSSVSLENLANAKIYITNESGTSSRAFKYYCKKRLGFNVANNRVDSIEKADAIFLIGDMALRFDDSKYQYSYDFGGLFYEEYAMPLIYGAIAVKKNIYKDVKGDLIALFNESLDIFETNRQSYLKEAANFIGKDSLGIDFMKEYFGNLKYKISNEEFEKAKEFILRDDNI